MSVYDALTAEQANRGGQDFEVWNGREITAVHEAAKVHFELAGLPIPTRSDVERAERYAQGSIDYGATWVYSLLNAMTRRSTEPSP